MTGHRQEAIKVLETALEKGDQFLPKESKAAFHLGIALANKGEDDMDAAASAARKVIELVPEESAHALQAQGIIINATEEGFEQQKHLSELEQLARRKKFYTAANNLALELRLQERVLHEKEDTYNKIRAVIDKAQLLQRSGRISELSGKDRRMLSSAYSYSYGQRMSSLFDRCHRVLLGVLSKENLWAQLVRLFRHSSFLWRLKGAEKEEVTYLHELDAVDLRSLSANEGASVQLEIHYLERRREEVGVVGDAA
jgi:hypothetical protein